MGEKTMSSGSANICLISMKKACEILGVSRTFFYENIVNRNLVSPVRLSRKCVRYQLAEVERCIASATQGGHEPYGY